ncbi:glucoamylase family protein [Paenisporosarcina sp. TG-14]|uniref:glucoamylase family protein n=1 Tax=Paenisporosarcina sp. TG-14 TaxID=1231057 RepID=UPI0003150208|nr:glucoamylase family protein [Paenisporosarcina sp. TG-14]
MNKMKIISFLIMFSFFTNLIFTPIASAGKVKEDAALQAELKAIAKQTYKYFQDHTDPKTGMTYDEVRFTNEEKTVAAHTSPTNIAMYMMSTVSAEQMGIITRKDAVKRLQVSINTLEKVDKWNGLYYNWYYTKDGSLKKDWGQFISQVDNGWLSAGLMVVGQAYKELNEQTSTLVENMDYSTLYDAEVGQFRGGYDVAAGKLTDHHYGMFYTEPRVGSYISIGKGDVPKEHWWKMYRTLPQEWDWQAQIPNGYSTQYDGVSVFEGHYEYSGIKYVPSWGGSMFEGLMPGIVLKEKDLGTKALGLNNKRHVEVQIAYAKDKGYKAWGFSPAATPDGYSEFAATPLGTAGYKDGATVTPHATFLALDYAPREVQKNIKVLKELNMYSNYGFYDSVNVETGEIAKAYLALDQGMIMVSIANYLKDGVIREYFHQDPIGKKPEELLIIEEFSIQ